MSEAGPNHHDLQVGDIVLWADQRHRVVHVYEGADEICLKRVLNAGEPDEGAFDQLYWDVQFLERPRLKPKKARRSRLGDTVMRALRHIDKYGASGLTHGRRYAEFGATIAVKSDCEFFLRTSDMLKPAGGNYPAHYVDLTDYGRECLARGWKDLNRSIPYWTRPEQYVARREIA